MDVPYVVLDSFERNMRDRLFYQVRGIDDRVISGFNDLPPMPDGTPLPTVIRRSPTSMTGFIRRRRSAP